MFREWIESLLLLDLESFSTWCPVCLCNHFAKSTSVWHSVQILSHVVYSSPKVEYLLVKSYINSGSKCSIRCQKQSTNSANIHLWCAHYDFYHKIKILTLSPYWNPRWLKSDSSFKNPLKYLCPGCWEHVDCSTR